MKARSPDEEGLRALRRLSVRGVCLVRDGDGRYRLSVAAGRRPRETVSAAVVESLAARGLVVVADEGLTLAESGRAYLRRALAGTDDYRAQHHDLARATVADADGVLQQVTFDRDESPLSWLRNRRDRDGRPLVDAAEFAAGERLRSD